MLLHSLSSLRHRLLPSVTNTATTTSSSSLRSLLFAPSSRGGVRSMLFSTETPTPSPMKRPSRFRIPVREREQTEQQQQQQQPVRVDSTSQDDQQYQRPTGQQLTNTVPGLSEYLGKVYGTTLGGIAVATGAGVAVATLFPAAMYSPLGLGLGGLVGSLASLFYLSSSKPVTFMRQDGSLFTQNSTARQVAAASFFAFSGVAIAPFVWMVALTKPGVIPLAVLSSAGVMGGMAAFALSRPSGSMLSWGAPLSGGLLGLMAIGVGSMFFPAMAPLAKTAFTWGALVIWTGFAAFDVQRVVHSYVEEKDADHLYDSVNFFLTFRGLFTTFLRIFYSND